MQNTQVVQRNPSDWIPYIVTESFFPLMVIFFLVWADGVTNVSRSELLLATCIFSFNSLIYARSRKTFWLSFLPAVLFCMAYAFEKGAPNILPYSSLGGVIILVVLLVCSITEKIWIPKKYDFPEE